MWKTYFCRCMCFVYIVTVWVKIVQNALVLFTLFTTHEYPIPQRTIKYCKIMPVPTVVVNAKLNVISTFLRFAQQKQTNELSKREGNHCVFCKFTNSKWASCSKNLFFRSSTTRFVSNKYVFKLCWCYKHLLRPAKHILSTAAVYVQDAQTPRRTWDPFLTTPLIKY